MTGGIVVVTGATGFIGRALCRKLMLEGFSVRVPGRETISALSATTFFRTDLADLADEQLTALSANTVILDGSTPQGQATDRRARSRGITEWQRALDGADTVIHLAGIAHRTDDIKATEFDRINHLASVQLAGRAASAGVRRFVYVSSINAMGESTGDRTTAILTPDSPAHPLGAYGASKLAAEAGLREVCADHPMQWSVVRPPLVYGPHARGNLLRLMQWVRAGLPIPAVRPENSRSMIGLDNLVDLLVYLVGAAHADSRIILPADVALSGSDLVRAIALAMKRPARLIPVPARWLSVAGRLTGRSDSVQRLTESLRIDDEWLRTKSGIAFMHSPQSMIDDMVSAYVNGQQSGRDLANQ